MRTVNEPASRQRDGPHVCTHHGGLANDRGLKLGHARSQRHRCLIAVSLKVVAASVESVRRGRGRGRFGLKGAKKNQQEPDEGKPAYVGGETLHLWK